MYFYGVRDFTISSVDHPVRLVCHPLLHAILSPDPITGPKVMSAERYLLLCNVNVNVNVISRTALIRNRVSRRVFQVCSSRVGVLYLFQEAQAH